jgi:hypothetical protein
MDQVPQVSVDTGRLSNDWLAVWKIPGCRRAFTKRVEIAAANGCSASFFGPFSVNCPTSLSAVPQWQAQP